MEFNKDIVKSLEKRNFQVHHVKTKDEARDTILNLINDNSKISWGGSQTLEEIDIKKSLHDNSKNKNLTIFDRALAKTPEDVKEIYLEAFSCDYYLSSANALLTDGRIINIDGRGNRGASTIYGPSRVIFVIGKNKIVEGNLDDAIFRVKNEASPPNAKRLNKQTGCYILGKCTDCKSPDRICRSISIIEWGKYSEEKIIVVLVDQDLGY